MKKPIVILTILTLILTIVSFAIVKKPEVPAVITQEEKMEQVFDGVTPTANPKMENAAESGDVDSAIKEIDKAIDQVDDRGFSESLLGL